MAIPFAAGARLPASDLEFLRSQINNNRIPLINQVGTGGTATVGTAETVVITFPAATFPAHTAFRITFQGLLRAATAANVASIAFRDTNISGTQRGSRGGFNLPTTTTNYDFNFDHYVANTGASDIVGRILCVTLATTAGQAAINAAATIPYSFVVTAVGTDTDWPQAVAL
jgi:hypothetical protein